MLLQTKTLTPIGSVYLVASEKGLRGVHLSPEANIPLTNKLEGRAGEILKEAIRQLKEYFDKERLEFDLPYDMIGTPFQKKVWDALTKIPFGKTCSYRDIAKRIKNEKATRAVGSANGKNPLCIIVPCHRVIAADGKLGGYSGGLHIKRKLLTHEGSSWLP